MTIEELAELLIRTDVDPISKRRVYVSQLAPGFWEYRDDLKAVVIRELKKTFGIEKQQTEFRVGDIVRWKCWIFELKAIYLDSDGTKKYKTCWEECSKRWVPASELELIERRK